MSWSKITSSGGTALYTWVRYADDANGTNMTDVPTGKTYLGLAFNKATDTPTANPLDYKWSLIKGDKGDAGSGTGTSIYTWVKYADDANGNNMSDSPAYKSYVGLAFNKSASTKSSLVSDYVWTAMKTPIVTTKDNEVRPLYIKSPDGYHQQYHPKVLFFANGWNGYKYWMASTPFPWQRETGEPYENPCIYASNDGFVWEVPSGLINPLDTPGAAGASYLSDTHLVFRDDTNTLECWYRPTGGATYGADGLVRRTSTDGINWTAREILIKYNDHVSSGINTSTLSPAIIWKNNLYEMWWVDGGTTNDTIWHGTSADGKSWSNVAKITLNLGTLANAYPWHLDCIYDNFNFYLVTYTKEQRLDLFQSANGTSFTYVRTLLDIKDSRGRDIYKDGLYRASITACGRRDSVPFYRVYYSANEATEKFSGIGVMEGQLLDMKHISGDLFVRKQVFYKGLEIVNSAKVQSNITLSDTGESIGFDYTTKEPYFQKADGTKVYFTR